MSAWRAKKHLLKARRLSVKQLCALDHLLVDPTGESFSGLVDRTLNTLDSRRRVTMAVPRFHLLFDVLRIDDFIASVPETIVRKRSGLKV